MIKPCWCQVCRAMLLDALIEGSACQMAALEAVQPTSSAAMKQEGRG
jgi:hypothetical protein